MRSFFYIASLALAFATAVNAEVYYLQLYHGTADTPSDGVDLAGHTKVIKLLAFEFNTTEQGVSSTTGAGAGKVDIEQFTITKDINKSSEDFVVGDTGITKAVLFLVKSAAEKSIEAEYTFTGVSVASIDYTGTKDVPTEKVTFNYEKLQIAYSPNASGSTKPPAGVSWDLAKNSAS